MDWQKNKSGEAFQNASKSILDPQDKSFICTKFQAIFGAIVTYIHGTIN